MRRDIEPGAELAADLGGARVQIDRGRTLQTFECVTGWSESRDFGDQLRSFDACADQCRRNGDGRSARGSVRMRVRGLCSSLEDTVALIRRASA